MIYPKWSQRIISLILILSLPGCASPAIPDPAVTQSVIESVTPASTEVLLVDPTSTQPPISSFEDCVASDNPIENTYPRQCTNLMGEVFQESLPKGFIFSKVYDVDGEKDHSLIPTIDGGYLITGTVDNFLCLIRKVDTSGETEWEHVLGAELREDFQFTNGLFVCRSAKQIADGSYVVFGVGWHEGGIRNNYYFLKLDNDGTKKAAEEFRWRNGMSLQLDEEGNPFWWGLFGILGNPVKTLDNGYAVIGKVWANTPDDSIHIVRADANGNYMWDRNLCKDKFAVEEWEQKIVCSSENLFDAIHTQDGGFVLIGGYSSGWLIKTNSDGFIEWMKTYDAARSYAIVQTFDGGFLIAGDKQGDGLLMKTDRVGDLQWTKTLGGDGVDVFNKMLINPMGQVIVIGSSQFLGGGTQRTWLLGIELSDFE